MTDLSTYEYNKAYVEQTEKTLEQYELKIKLLNSDIETIINHLNEAEKVVKTIANTYKLPEAVRYFNNDAS